LGQELVLGINLKPNLEDPRKRQTFLKGKYLSSW